MPQPFKTGLIIHSSTKKDLKLNGTHQIHCFESCFGVSPGLDFVYCCDNGISVYTTNPMNKIKTLDYKEKIREIAVGGEHLYILNDSSLALYSKDGFNVLTKDFTDCRVLALDKKLIGVQSRSELAIYNHAFARLNVFSCQCSFAARGLLVTGSMNTVRVYIHGKKAFEVAMPDYITCITADTLFSKIFCAAQNNNIYAFDLTGKPMATMEYHTKPVRQMKFNFASDTLYTCDGQRICVWSTADCVVKDYVDVEEGVASLETFLVDEMEYGEPLI